MKLRIPILVLCAAMLASAIALLARPWIRELAGDAWPFSCELVAVPSSTAPGASTVLCKLWGIGDAAFDQSMGTDDTSIEVRTLESGVRLLAPPLRLGRQVYRFELSPATGHDLEFELTVHCEDGRVLGPARMKTSGVVPSLARLASNFVASARPGYSLLSIPGEHASEQAVVFCKLYGGGDRTFGCAEGVEDTSIEVHPVDSTVEIVEPPARLAAGVYRFVVSPAQFESASVDVVANYSDHTRVGPVRMQLCGLIY